MHFSYFPSNVRKEQLFDGVLSTAPADIFIFKQMFP